MLGNTADTDGALVADHQFDDAFALTIERDVIVLGHKLLDKRFRQSASAGHKVQKVAVVLVVLCTSIVKDFLQRLVVFYQRSNFVKHGLCQHRFAIFVCAKVQRLNAFVLGTDGRHVRCKHLVDSLTITDVWLSVFQFVYDPSDIGSPSCFHKALNTTIIAGNFLDCRRSIGHGLRHNVHALVVRTEVVQHLGALERLHVLGQTFKACKAVNKLCLKRKARCVGFDGIHP